MGLERCGTVFSVSVVVSGRLGGRSRGGWRLCLAGGAVLPQCAISISIRAVRVGIRIKLVLAGISRY